MPKDLPFIDQIKKLNYSLHSHDTISKNALYTKRDLALKVKPNGQAELFAVLGLLKISIEFSFPHPKFSFFESKVIELLNGHKWL